MNTKSVKQAKKIVAFVTTVILVFSVMTVGASAFVPEEEETITDEEDQITGDVEEDVGLTEENEQVGADIPEYETVELNTTIHDILVNVDWDSETDLPEDYEWETNATNTITNATEWADQDDTILVYPGIYNATEEPEETFPLTIETDGVTLMSKEGPEETTIISYGEYDALDIQADWVTVTGFDIVRDFDVDEAAEEGHTGILVENTDGITITENDITGFYEGIRVTEGNGDVTINHNNIEGNEEYGVLNEADFEVNAKENWWDDISGPSGEALGDGDAVSENVDYTWWLDDEYPDGEATKPQITEVFPAEGEVVSGDELDITAVMDYEELDYSLERATVTLVDEWPAWEAEIDENQSTVEVPFVLREGEHTYEIYMEDENGNYNSTEVTFEVDNTEPMLELEIVNDVEDEDFTIHGETEPDADVWIFYDDVEATVTPDEDGEFTYETTIGENQTLFTVIAEDDAGNVVEKEFTAIYLPELTELREDIEALEDRLDDEVADLEGDIEGIQEDISDIEDDIAGLEGDIEGIQDDISAIEGDIADLEDDIAAIQSDIDGLEDEQETQADDIDMARNLGIVGIILAILALIVAAVAMSKKKPAEEEPTIEEEEEMFDEEEDLFGEEEEDEELFGEETEEEVGEEAEEETFDEDLENEVKELDEELDESDIFEEES